MKARIFQLCGLALVLAVIPFFAGCDEEQARSAQVTGVATGQPLSQPPVDAITTDTNQPQSTDANRPATVSDEDLANAPGKVISTPEVGSTNTVNNPRLNDFVKLVQAGVGENVLMAYVTNSPDAFNVSSDDILYLNDLGAPETVVSAMLQRDQHFNSNSSPAPAAAQTQSSYANTYANQASVPAPPAATPEGDETAMAQAPQAMPPLTPSPEIEADVQQAPNVSYSYFYDSLSPYGSWIDIQGYGPCWQPTAVAGNPGWQPYCDRGHWAYTDCGWCWVSDYSWGWAPFHYGRWFHHNRWGWCWAPDTTWSPAWVSWRYNDAYCGWAPLPPTACFRPGFGFTYFGRSVGFNFGFGLAADRFVFLPLGHFHDRFPSRYRLPHREVTKIYNGTTVHNQLIRGNNNTLINRGVPVSRVAAVTRTEIRPIHVRADASAPRSSQLGRDGRSLSVYRPALPTPKPAVNSRLVGEGVQPNAHFDLHSRVNRAPMTRPPAISAGPERRPVIANPNAAAPAMNPGRDNRFSQPGGERPNSLILRGPDRATPSRNDNPGQATPPNLRHGPLFPPNKPTVPIAPADNNRRGFVPPVQQPIQPAQPQQTLPPPSFNRPANSDDLRRNGSEMQRQPRELQQQQQQWQQPQQPAVQMPRQGTSPRTFEAPRGTPRMNDQNINPGFRSEPAIRSEPIAPARPIEARPAPEIRSAPPQFSAPAHDSHQDNSPGRGGGGGGAGGGNPGGGGGRGNGNNGGNGGANGNGRGNR